MKTWGKILDEEREAEAARTNLMIVDGMNLAFRFRNSSKSFASEYVKTIYSLAKTYNAKRVIILSDKGTSVYRKEIFPEYKANRAAKYATQTEEEKEKSRLFFEYLEEALDLCKTKHPTFFKKGVEADDMAAYAVSSLKEEFDHIWLISTDGDWDTLLDENVSRFSFTTKKEYHLRDFYENNGCDSPEQFVSLKAIQGDLGDNIRGVEGIGAKRGYGILREYNGNILDVIDAMPIPGKQVFIKNLNESEELLLRNLYLVDLPSFCIEAIQAVGDGFFDEYHAGLQELLND
jgi:5'-3' exonuclease